jgi:hypothetical protein
VFLAFTLLAMATACETLTREEVEAREAAIDGLRTEVASLQTSLAQTELQVLEMRVEQQELVTAVDTQSEAVTSLSGEVASLPGAVRGMCTQPAPEPSTCGGVQRVIMAGDKMVLGELEQVWIDPPGFSLHARVDTGATSNSLSAENLVEFERDGEDWVRFVVNANQVNEPITMERRVVRRVRVFQQADPEGTRRPVVNLRLVLGDVQDTFEFTLADRSHLNYQILLGRNFLTDVALVDVGKQFVQPPYVPKRPDTTADSAE